jgi:excisionase family DNA binding protein
MTNAARRLSDLTVEEFIELMRSERAAPAEPRPVETYVDAEAVAKHFGVHRGTVHNWVHKEGCPHEMRGKILRFRLEAVEAWFRNRPTLRKVR